MTSRALGALALLLIGSLLVAAPAHPGVRAQPAAGDLTVLVLGDSYSAGNGATADDGSSGDFGPEGCERSTAAWGERYAAGLRAQGTSVTLANRACSGAVTADLLEPRVLGTERKVQRTPAGVSTKADADAWLVANDPCNTGAFPDEERWGYAAGTVTPLTFDYTCTRTVRPQVDFVSADVDLVLLTIGGNDAGFSTIVSSCFVPVTRTSDSCRAAIAKARSLLPEIQQRVRADLDAVRARLRPDARIVQLGYPLLQVDNDFRIGLDSYPAGAEVRALVAEGNAGVAAAVAGVTGAQFATGVPETFAGHEPDASTPIGNGGRWINQVGDGAEVVDWYHPNGLGHAAYARLLLAGGTFGAPTTTTPGARPAADLRVRAKKRAAARVAVLRVRVSLSDDTTPVGRIKVRTPGGRPLASERLRARADGRTTVRVRGLRPGKRVLVVRYVDRGEARAVVERQRVRVRR